MYWTARILQGLHYLAIFFQEVCFERILPWILKDSCKNCVLVQLGLYLWSLEILRKSNSWENYALHFWTQRQRKIYLYLNKNLRKKIISKPEKYKRIALKEKHNHIFSRISVYHLPNYCSNFRKSDWYLIMMHLSQLNA